ncbi:hypothetical protein LPJ79_005797 [Coemansia sp. RSA 1821]|nr:hypothetical protein LPJ79_005797 [Coemansia sp. RSA 1821]
MAYFISKSSRSSHVLIQEPIVKHENTAENEDESQFLYTALRPAHSTLILVPEPFDPNNSSPALQAPTVYRRHKGSSVPSNISARLARSAGWLSSNTLYDIQSTRGTQSTSASSSAAKKNPRFIRAIKILEDGVEARDIDAVWRAYMELRDLERSLGQSEVVDEMNRQFPPKQISLIIHNLLPDFKPQPAAPEVELAARHVYMFTKLLNYFLLVSRLRQSQRNDVAVLRLTMGRCIRRLIDFKYLRTAEDAKMLVRQWKKISESSSTSLQLTNYEIYMLVLGAWKSGRHLLVPYLYRLACQNWRIGDEGHFQRLSALMLSFYVREYPNIIDPSVVRGILVDMKQRLVKLTSHHYSMLILYFGKTQNLDEAMNIIEQAINDPDAQGTEAIYYNAFRAFGCAFAQKKQQQRNFAAKEIENGTTQDQEFSYVDKLDTNTDNILMQNSDDLSKTHHNPECLQAARICMWLFRRMTSTNVSVGYKTFRELMDCMVQFEMPDKARRIFEFAMDSLSGTEIKAHLISHYLHLIGPTAHLRQLALRGLIKQNKNIAFAMTMFSKRVLVDQFGIFEGDLKAFVAKETRPPTSKSEFLSRFVFRMYKATRAAKFINCILSGNDPTGQFKGYNFPKLVSGGAGLATIENHIYEACHVIHKLKPQWLQHCDVIYNLLPVLPGITPGDSAHPEPDDIGFIRQLIGSCLNVSQFIARLDGARIENYDIEMINQFLRVKYLGLTFQRYVKEKYVLVNDQLRPLFWPTFLYVQSNGPVVLDDDGPLVSIDRGVYSRDIAQMIPEVVTSWQHLVGMFDANPHSSIAVNANTIGIFSRIAIYAEAWEFGQQIWSDVLRLMGSKAGAPKYFSSSSQLPLQTLRVYKHYLQFLALAAQRRLRVGSSAYKSTGKERLLGLRPSSHRREFNEDTLVDMFLLMERNGVGVTSGLLCQGISAAFKVGQVDVGGALEQWQLYRERQGLAENGFLQQYFASVRLPEVPAAVTSVMGAVHGTTGCPRLADFVTSRIHNNRQK